MKCHTDPCPNEASNEYCVECEKRMKLEFDLIMQGRVVTLDEKAHGFED